MHFCFVKSGFIHGNCRSSTLKYWVFPKILTVKLPNVKCVYYFCIHLHTATYPTIRKTTLTTSPGISK